MPAWPPSAPKPAETHVPSCPPSRDSSHLRKEAALRHGPPGSLWFPTSRSARPALVHTPGGGPPTPHTPYPEPSAALSASQAPQSRSLLLRKRRETAGVRNEPVDGRVLIQGQRGEGTRGDGEERGARGGGPRGPGALQTDPKLELIHRIEPDTHTQLPVTPRLRPLHLFIFLSLPLPLPQAVLHGF